MTNDAVPSSRAARAASAGSRIRQFAGHSFACTMSRTAAVPASQVGNTTPAVARNVGRRWMRIHASVITPSDPLAADDHAVRARPGAGSGQAPALPPPLRREHAHRFDEVVDVRVVGGVVAAGTGGDPPSERREAEALREVAQREPVRPELVLERRPVDAGLDAGRPRDRIDLEDLIEAIHRHGHDGVRLRRVDSPDHRRPGTERNDLHTVGRAPVEHGLELGLRAAGGRQRRSGSGSAG